MKFSKIEFTVQTNAVWTFLKMWNQMKTITLFFTVSFTDRAKINIDLLP